MKPAVLAGTLAAALSLAGAAHAEKWVYFPIPGGALAYDDDSRRTEVATGLVAADVLIFYFVPQAMGANAYNIRSERMEFDCRASLMRSLGVALFDDAQALGVDRSPSPWTKTPPGGPPSVFQRIFCGNARPPTAREVSDQASLRTALHALPPTSGRSSAPAARPPPATKP
jgi:hypothetical protein